MVKQRNVGKAKAKVAKKDSLGPPAPFKQAPEVLQPLLETLDEEHVYIFHVDSKPPEFKRNIFLVPCAMNIAIVAFIIWRIYYISPYYLRLLASTLGYPNETTLLAAELSYEELTWEVSKRAGQFIFDLAIYIFLAPWPISFAFGQEHGNPIMWRWNVGFREREVVVRRSRGWDKALKSLLSNPDTKKEFVSRLSEATSAALVQGKTGYLLMNADWDLDWGVMVDATTMVDKKMVAIDAFKLMTLVYREEYGWMSVEMKLGDDAVEDVRRRQVLAFRDALSAVDKEDLFYRWIELIQFESSQPGGFSEDRQVEAAKQVRELFAAQNIDFDAFWKESVGSEGLAGMDP